MPQYGLTLALLKMVGAISIVDKRESELFGDLFCGSDQIKGTLVIDLNGKAPLSMLKGALPFRSITNVPFIWSDPQNRSPKSSDSLLSTIDIAPTILSRANVKPYWGIQGVDFLQSIERKISFREDLMIEFHDNIVRFGFDKPAFVRSVSYTHLTLPTKA